MAPFSMRCTSCGEYIYKGRKFNARKETPENEKYLGIQIFRFYIRCTRCSAEITFTTDPKNADYACERGAKRNVEPWRQNTADETDQERLERLEKEEEQRNAMVELEAKTVDAKQEMAVADALDEIRVRNAKLARAERDGVEFTVADSADDEAARQEQEDSDAARRAFMNMRQMDVIVDEVLEDVVDDGEMLPPPLPTFSKAPLGKKKAGTAILGIIRTKEPAAQPQPVKQAERKPAASLVSYDSDSD